MFSVQKHMFSVRIHMFQAQKHKIYFVRMTFSIVSIYSSGCCPSCAFHAHSVIFMSVKTALKEDSSGEHA